MSARTRAVFKEKIGPRISRSHYVRWARFIVSIPMLKGDTKAAMEKRVKKELDLHEPCPVKIWILPDTTLLLSPNSTLLKRRKIKETPK